MYVLMEFEECGELGFCFKGMEISLIIEKITQRKPTYNADKSSYLIVHCFKSFCATFTKSNFLGLEYENVQGGGTSYEVRNSFHNTVMVRNMKCKCCPLKKGWVLL